MFDLPDAKRVRRSDIFSSASSPTSSRQSSPADDPELTALLRARLDEKLGIAIDAQAPPPQSGAQEAPISNTNNADDDGEEELEFRLFAPSTAKPAAVPTKSTAAATTDAPKPAPAAVQKIRLRSPSLDPDRPAGFVVPSRPQSYYFAPDLSATPKSAEYTSAAVSGEEIVRLARETRWPGCAVPWKVSLVDPASRQLRRALEEHVKEDGSDGDTTKRRRKSKKARVALRKKKMQGLERKEAAEKAKQEKEEHERAKRAEKNRKQKLKRREKERAKKAAERGEGVVGAEGGEEEDVVMESD